MKSDKAEYKKRYFEAKKRLRRIRLFYLHLVGYLLMVALVLYNFYIMEDNEYTSVITGVNVSFLVLWSVVILIHGWVVFKGPLLFKKTWEEKKIKEILKEEEVETTFWE